MTRLRKKILPSLASNSEISLPVAGIEQLPEKVLQFGTGVLLRGLPDYYINKANNSKLFNGRIIVIKSTTGGSSNDFAEQDCLYTHCIKGIVDSVVKESYIINAAISRVIDANKDWREVLHCASNRQLQIIISNTTEVGISLLEEDSIHASPPQSFPGKLLAFLYECYKAFNGSHESGMVIIPTELIVDNGDKLKSIVIKLAQLNQLGESFINWLSNANDWCSSLVDRIVPGSLTQKDKQQLQDLFGYNDDLAIMSEPYNLWAIETTRESTKEVLSFHSADEGIVITSDIKKYRELKLYLLNATHTFSCGLAFLSHFNAVNEAMQDKIFHRFISNILLKEIVPCILSTSISMDEAEAFAGKVMDRFANPFIQHQWLAITLQYTGKMKSRCVPLIGKQYKQRSQPGSLMTLGFAAYLLFMKAAFIKDDCYYGERSGEPYLIQDNDADKFYSLWQNKEASEVVFQALADKSIWDEDLTLLPHFADDVSMYLQMLLSGKKTEEIIALSL